MPRFVCMCLILLYKIINKFFTGVRILDGVVADSVEKRWVDLAFYCYQTRDASSDQDMYWIVSVHNSEPAFTLPGRPPRLVGLVRRWRRSHLP
jgi:hypothetical protein